VKRGIHSTSVILARVSVLLAEPERWTRRALARSVLGTAVGPLSELASCWSVSGALARSLYDLMGPRVSDADWQAAYDATVLTLWQALPADHPRTHRHGLDLDGFNDYPATTHQHILSLLDLALAQREMPTRAPPRRYSKY
jgi:hypothetical protein